MTKSELKVAFATHLDAINEHYPKQMTVDEISHYQSDVIKLLLRTCKEIIDMLPDTPPDASPVTPSPCTSRDGGK